MRFLFVLVCPLYFLLQCTPAPSRIPVHYTEAAHAAYDDAMQEFKEQNWLDAQAKLREVQQKYPHSRFARLAMLRRADIDFEQQSYPEAIQGYRSFLHRYRTDKEGVAHARKRIGEAYYHQIAPSFFLNSDERDQNTVLDAYQELTRYLHDYDGPTEESSPLRMYTEEVQARLFRYELYVASFYLKRSNSAAAVERLRYALEHYGIHAKPTDQTKHPTEHGKAQHPETQGQPARLQELVELDTNTRRLLVKVSALLAQNNGGKP